MVEGGPCVSIPETRALLTLSLWTNIVLSQCVTNVEDLTRWFLKNCGPSLLLSWDTHLQVVDKWRYATRNLSDDLIDAFSTNLHRFESLVIRAFPESCGGMSSRSPHASLMQSIQQMDFLLVHLKRLYLPFYPNMETTEAVTGLTQKMKANHFTHFALSDQGEECHVQCRWRPSWISFLDFLRFCLVLESLWIEDAGPSTVKKEDIWEVMDTINMSNLQCV